MIRWIELQRCEWRKIDLRRYGDTPMRKPLVIGLHHIDVVGPRCHPISTVTRGPDDIWPLMEFLPCQVHIGVVAGEFPVVEIPHEVCGNVCGLWHRCVDHFRAQSISASTVPTV